MTNTDYVWLLALLCGFTFTFAVIGVPTGLGLFLFSNMILGVLWFLYSRKDKKDLARNKEADMVLKVFAGFYVLLTIPYLYRLDEMVTTGLVAYHFLYIAVFSVLGLYPALLAVLNPFNMFIYWLSAGLNWVIHIFKTIFSLLQLESSRVKFLLKTVIYVTISLVIFIVFVTLLSQADANFRERILRILEQIKFGEIVVRTFAGLIFVFIFAGAFKLVTEMPVFGIIAAKKEFIDEQLAKVKQFIHSKFSDAFLPLLVTVPIFFIFLLFVYLQFKYLFGVSIDEVLSTLTFSEYARKGFWELLLVVALTYPILAWVSNHSRTEKLLPRVINFIVSSSIVGFVYVMLYSAFVRMGIYSEVYGPSVRRNYVILAIIVLAIGMTLYQVLAAVKAFKPQFRILASQFFGDYIILAALIAVSLLSIVAIVPWNSVTLQQIAAKYEKTGNIDVYQIVELPMETTREVYLFADGLEQKYAQQIEDGSCATDMKCPSFGIRFLKARSLIKKEQYTKGINSSIFTRVFGLNITGLMLETFKTPARDEYISQVTSTSERELNAIVNDFASAIERNDFAAARALYDPKMQASNLRAFKSGVSLTISDVSTARGAVTASDMFGHENYGSYAPKYVTYTLSVQVTRDSSQIQGVSIRPLQFGTDDLDVYAQESMPLQTSKSVTNSPLVIRVGTRNGKPVIVYSNLELAYLPEAFVSEDGEYNYILSNYGYEAYCGISTTSEVPRDLPVQKCFSGIETVGNLTAEDFLLNTEK
ncbi:MAG: DUF4173 domain-containing protein [Candidatus Dojkabacteria bacterium]|nr:MAG: DUF4173 domain-containing protein [Candidatus Dojkabacteria bacterium]